MSSRLPKTNHEHAARAEKVLKLCLFLAGYEEYAARTTPVSRERIREQVRTWTNEEWALAAQGAGCNPPSETTIRQVLANYG